VTSLFELVDRTNELPGLALPKDRNGGLNFFHLFFLYITHSQNPINNMDFAGGMAGGMGGGGAAVDVMSWYVHNQTLCVVK